MDVARSAPQGAHYCHASVICLFPYMGIMVLRVKPTPTRFPINNRYTPKGKHILYQVCVATGEVVDSLLMGSSWLEQCIP